MKKIPDSKNYKEKYKINMMTVFKQIRKKIKVIGKSKRPSKMTSGIQKKAENTKQRELLEYEM